MTRKRYPQIADDLRVRILSGELTPGTQLPVQTDLEAEYRASTQTVRNALAVLAKEGLIYSIDKIGVFVRDQHRYRLEVRDRGPTGFSPPFPSLASRLLAELAKPDQPLVQTIEIRRGTPSREILDRLNITDEPVMTRHQVFYAEDQPISFANGYYPAGLVAGSALERAEPVDSVFDVLDDLQSDPHELVNEILIRNATALERQEMHWPSGMFVLVQICTTHTMQGRPVYCWESVLPGDRWILAERQYRDAHDVRAVG